MEESRIFQVKIDNEEQLVTKNLVKGTKMYEEKIIMVNGEEFLEWNPYNCKLAAAIRNGLQILPIIKNSKIICICGKAETTISHISDIVYDGSVFVVGDNNKNDLLKNLDIVRKNIISVSDNQFEQLYSTSITKKIDVLYVDIPQFDQMELVVKKYSLLLKTGGFLMLTIKKDENPVFESDSVEWFAEQKSGLTKIQEQIKKLKPQFEIIQEINLSLNYLMNAPFHKSYVFILAQYLQKNNDCKKD
jgi:fibrillarin-like pre-rRNA processing protein